MIFIDPPEGILHPTQPWGRINPNSRLWLILKSKLTGRRQGDESYTSYVNLSDADADRLIANMKKDPRGYPSLDQESGTPLQWMDRQKRYQEWLVEAYLEIPFREEVDRKIEEREIERRSEEIRNKREKAADIADTINVDKKVNPEKFIPNPVSIPDPWEGSATVPQGVRPDPSSTEADQAVATPPPSTEPPSAEQQQLDQGIFPKIEGFGLLEGLSVQLVQLKDTLNGTRENISAIKKETEEHNTILSKLADTLKDSIELKQKLKQQEDINREKESVASTTDTSGFSEPDRGLDGEDDGEDSGGIFDSIKDFLDLDLPDGRRRRRGAKRRLLRRRLSRFRRRIRLPKFRGRLPKFRMPNIRMPGGSGRAAKFFGGASRLGGRALQILNIPVLGDMILPEGTSQYDQTSGPNAYYNAPGYKGPKPPQYERGGIARGPKSGFTAILHGREAVIPIGGSRRSIRSGGKYETGNIIEILRKQAGISGGPDEKLLEKKKKEEDFRIYSEAVEKGLLLFEKKKPMDILRKMLGATGEKMFDFWKRIFAAAWDGVANAAKALINFARMIAGEAVNFLFGGAAQAATTAVETIGDNLTALGESLTGGTKEFGGLTGTSGTVAYGGKEGVKLGAAYSPFSQADIRSKGITITSGKGYRRSTSSNHKGYDVGAPAGTPMYAYLPGKVTATGVNGRGDGGYGNFIEWKDNVYNQTHFFGHMQGSPAKKVGDTVSAGEMLGRVGGTGYGKIAYPDHLHWEIGPRGGTIDPGAWTKAHPLPSEKPSVASKPPPGKPRPGQDPTEGKGGTTIVNNIVSTVENIGTTANRAMSTVQNALNPLSAIKQLSLIK